MEKQLSAAQNSRMQSFDAHDHPPPQNSSPHHLHLMQQHSSRPLPLSLSTPLVPQNGQSVVDRDEQRAQFLWGMWHTGQEVTFLLDERDIELFPQDTLISSPQQWRVIKLCGRAIDFNETGVVSAMSKVDAHIPLLNISTATTNCTLVPEELLDTAVQKLSALLGCPAKYVSAL